MTSIDLADSTQFTRFRGSKYFRLCNRMAILGISFGAIAMTGCGSTGWGRRQCRSQAVHPTCYSQTATVSQPAYLQTTKMVPTQSNQELLGGCGLTPSEPMPIESPVEVAPVPQQWTQPAEGTLERPAIDAKPDLPDLDRNKVAEPMEI